MKQATESKPKFSRKKFDERVGTFIRHMRKQRKLTQVELAPALQISQAQLSKLEKGKAELTAREYFLLCKKLGLSLSSIESIF